MWWSGAKALGFQRVFFTPFYANPTRWRDAYHDSTSVLHFGLRMKLVSCTSSRICPMWEHMQRVSGPFCMVKHGPILTRVQHFKFWSKLSLPRQHHALELSTLRTSIPPSLPRRHSFLFSYKLLALLAGCHQQLHNPSTNKVKGIVANPSSGHCSVPDNQHQHVNILLDLSFHRIRRLGSPCRRSAHLLQRALSLNHLLEVLGA